MPGWKHNVLRFRLATKLHKEDGDVQVSALVYTMETFTLAEGDEKKFNVKLAKFDEHFVPKRNVIQEGALSYQRNQRQGDTVESFVRSLSV